MAVTVAETGGAAGQAVVGPTGPAVQPLEIVREMQRTTFSADWATFRSLFRDDTYYRVGNTVQRTGGRAISEYLQGMLEGEVQITAMDVRGAWQTDDVAIVEYNMQGVRVADHQRLAYPCIDIYRFVEAKFRDWRVYPITPEFVGPTSRIAADPPPVGRGPADPAGVAGMKTVQGIQTALAQGKWDAVPSYVTDDVVLRVADAAEVVGPQRFVESLLEVFGQRLRPTAADFRGIWPFANALVVELLVQATRLADGQQVSYPCAETYRMRDGRIAEYRIYPIERTLLK